LWLLNDRYRGHRLIVWSATIHAAHNVASVDTRDSSWSYADYRPTGDRVWTALGKQVYVLGFVALTGGGRLGNDSWQIKQDQDPAAELEELLGATGLDAAFLDYRHIPRGGEWLREPMLSRPFAEHAKIARWPDVLDGIVFLREMQPATWPNFDVRIRGGPARQ
jgi:erythromycin esterase-like protein